MEREAEDRRRSKLLQHELTYFIEHLDRQLERRTAAEAKKAAELKEFEDAAKLLEEAEQRKLEAEERERKRIKEERERIRREKQLAIERARQAEEARKREEEERDTAGTRPYLNEITVFINALPKRLAMRAEEAERVRLAEEQLEQERQRRLANRAIFGNK